MFRTVLAVLVLAGCASLTEVQCRGDEAQWEWLGEYDAVQGDQPWIEAYAEVCRPYGVAVLEQAYLKGWETGHAEFNRRVEFGD
jgi:hypothetical protein